jgi:DUF1680 family protein
VINGEGEGGRPFLAVPYYSWNNRGQSEMAVWIKESLDDDAR